MTLSRLNRSERVTAKPEVWIARHSGRGNDSTPGLHVRTRLLSSFENCSRIGQSFAIPAHAHKRSSESCRVRSARPLRTEWLEGEKDEIIPNDQALVRGAGGRILFVVSRSSACLPALIHEFTARSYDGTRRCA